MSMLVGDVCMHATRVHVEAGQVPEVTLGEGEAG